MIKNFTFYIYARVLNSSEPNQGTLPKIFILTKYWLVTFLFLKNKFYSLYIKRQIIFAQKVFEILPVLVYSPKYAFLIEKSKM